jgi:hypothetical protein
MINDPSPARDALWRAFGNSPAPVKIRQETFEGNDKHLKRLAKLSQGDRAKPRDLWEYAQDLRHAEIETSLFTYLLPFCLDAWRGDLLGTQQEFGGFVEHFYPLLAEPRVFESHLTHKQVLGVSEFMRLTILDEIEAQRGLAYRGARARPNRWIGALASFGVLRPEVDRLWTDWWSIKTVGYAVAAVQYISCLMYEEHENPVFAPWTPNEGGGPPCLWEFEGHLYESRWLDQNVSFLTRILTATKVREALTRAVKRLVDEPEHSIAAGIEADLPLCGERLESRCGELPRFFATTQMASTSFEWST